MNVRELRDMCDKLIENGLAETKVLKSSDDEGNSYDPVSTIQEEKGTEYRHHYEIVHPDDYDEYDDLVDFVCIW